MTERTGRARPADQGEYLAAHIQEKVAASVHELGVRVDVRGNAVFLRGEVMTEERRREVEDAAHGAAEGLRVRNEVTVVPAPEPDGEETLS